MNKYKSLISNTLVFGISTFGSKVLSFLFQRLYTSLLPPSEMGTATLIVSTCNLILPIMYLCIAESVLRFGLDDGYNKKDVFSVGVITVLAGYGVLWCLYPLLAKVNELQGYTYLIYVYVIASAARTLITQFIRANGMIRLFAIDGIFTMATTIICNVIFMVVLKMGIVGYVLSTAVADGLSAISLFVLLKLHRFLKLRGIDAVTIKDMFRYALPLIPTAVGWWVTNLSDRYFVTILCGSAAQGLYNMAYYLPSMITSVSAIFTRAWELSAFTEYQSDEGERFFSNVFRSYYTFVFVIASGLILLIKPIIRIWLPENYYDAWQYAPFLVLAVSFSCLVTFLGAVYNAAKQNIMVTVTTVAGAVVNIILNAILIPVYGVQGAAIATFISFLAVFLMRAVDTQKYMRIHMQPLRMALNTLLLLAQAILVIAETPLWPLWGGLLFGLLVLFNLGNLLVLLQRLLSMLRRRRRA